MNELSELETYNWATNQRLRLPGTEDWIEVAKLGDQGGYEWTDFNAYYSPSARRYFWHGDGGCSCNSWSDGLGSADDLQNGGRADLLRAWEEFAKEHTYSIGVTGYLDGVSTIKKFKEPK
ncbi:hypothetical protein SEA_EVEPICKLES_66 [Arthrobacter phage EvePickles]|nr:hypothetical protein SEA_EVEPICKLES_66 [Arthrobacter phage EvePickles]